MTTNAISGFLEKFKKIGAERFLLKEVVVTTLKAVCGITVAPHTVSYKDAVILVQTSPLVKSVIYTKKTQILTVLKEKLPQVVVKDIR